LPTKLYTLTDKNYTRSRRVRIYVIPDMRNESFPHVGSVIGIHEHRVGREKWDGN
jgi:hypothetical protein